MKLFEVVALRVSLATSPIQRTNLDPSRLGEDNPSQPNSRKSDEAIDLNNE
jgi:hypothetical protein